jgi:hypothetical protein
MIVTARTAAAAQEGARSNGDRWPLTRVLIFLLANGFVGLVIDIRVEHVDVVH